MPSLAKQARLRRDPISGDPVLLHPEGILVLNSTAYDIVSRCDGATTVDSIALALASQYEITTADVADEIMECLGDLHRRNLILFSS